MRHLLALLFVCWPSLLLAQEDGALSVRIELPETGKLELYSHFNVILRNESELPIRTWHRETREGYFQFSFHFEDTITGDSITVRARIHEDPEEWDYIDREIAASEKVLQLAPQEEIPVRISTNGYDYVGWPTPNSGHAFKFQAKFQSEATDLNREKLIWVGKAESKPLTTTFLAPKLQTPSDYIEAGFSEKAIEMMEENPSLIWTKYKPGSFPFETAVGYGELKAVRWLLERGADRNLSDEQYAKLLMSNDNVDIVALLLKRKVNLEVELDYGTPLSHASYEFTQASNEYQSKRWLKICKLLLDAGANYDLFSAINLDDLRRVKEILKVSPELATTDDEDQYSPLRIAASIGRFEICKYLIENFQIDLDDFERGAGFPIIKDALMYPEIVKLLIENGADLKTEITWKGGRSGGFFMRDEAKTALHHAAFGGVPETIELLIDRGLDIMTPTYPVPENEVGHTALHLASWAGAGGNAQAIINHSKFQQIEKVKRQMMLDECVLLGVDHYVYLNNPDRSALVKVLLDAGANPHLKSKDGETALQIAASGVASSFSNGYQKESAKRTVALLLQHGMELDLDSAVMIEDVAQVERILKESPELANSRRSSGYPILHYAIDRKHLQIVKLFIAAGADPKLKNEVPSSALGQTALELAKWYVDIPERHRTARYNQSVEILDFLEQAAKQK
ncbi:MAG TPA: ankyrin repeat domain-containing protein [Planctomycetaceae bacterium]|nr:ankyrin repeat domain-containing protein [Planctomycetaceae bacterium]